MFINSKSVTGFKIGLIICLFSMCVHAMSAETRFSGFANIGLTYSDSHELKYRSSIINNAHSALSLKPDTLLGLQVNHSFSQNLDAVGQIILQDRSNNEFSSYLELAFLRYQIDRNWSVKAGRFSTNSYLFTDYRYVGQAIPWVRPPVEMYSTVGALGNMNGLKVNYIMDTSFGTANVGLSHGSTIFKNKSGIDAFKIQYEKITAFNLELQATQWRAQLAYLTATLGDIQFDDKEMVLGLPSAVPSIFAPFAQQIATNLVPTGEDLTYLSIGGQYSHNNVDYIIEWADYKSEFLAASSARFGYATVVWNVDEFSPYVTLGVYKRKDDTPEVLDYALAEQLLPSFAFEQLVSLSFDSNEFARNASIDQSSVSVGVKWELTFDWTIKAQVDHYRMNQLGSALFEVQSGMLTPNEKLSFNVFNLNFSTTF